MTITSATQPDKSRRRRRCLGSTTATVIGTMAVLLANQMTPTDSFTALQQTAASSTIRLFFRSQLAEVTTAVLAKPSSLASQLLTPPSETATTSTTRTTVRQEASLPTWLSLQRSHLAEKNLQKLQSAMHASFFTENESLKLLYAIEEAAGTDRNLIAGAAEFCLILTDHMEMGLNALVAAAFHYCSCVHARQTPGSTYNLETSAAVESFGEHAAQIATDAARLKRLEMVGAAVMMAGTHAARVAPDSRDAENLRKLLLSETKDWRALAIRSAACLYRLQGLKQARNLSGKTDLTPEAVRCAREALYIYAPLASRLGMHRLKNELEGAAFRQLYRRQYDLVHSQSTLDDSNINQSMTGVLNTVQTEMTAMLEQDEEFMSLVDNFSVTARVKEPYSMWKKMLCAGYVNILQVPDALALRVVFDAKKLSSDEPSAVTSARECALCYYAQKLCMGRWQPNVSNPRFKDYIEIPKPNGYQSLHYTAKSVGDDGQDWTMEIQVRSGEMHQVAEYGLASHWDYKAQKNTSDKNVQIFDKEDHSSDAYLRSVQEWHWQMHGQQRAEKAMQWETDSSPASFEPVVRSDIWQSRVRADRIRARTQRLAPYIQALTAAQSDLAREFVFVFLTQANQSDGKVLALPAGACVLDALREGAGPWSQNRSETDLALNGAATSVTRQLRNGDVLTLPVAWTTAVPTVLP